MSSSDAEQHLERIYTKKMPQEVTWYLPHLEITVLDTTRV